MPLSLETIERRLARHEPARPSRLAPTRAAVAAVLRFDRPAAEVLLMERAPRAGDRWSGQVSFPGGREEPEDPDLLATAVRETREEVGLDIAACARPLGCLDPVRAVARGKLLPMSVTPFVFAQTRAAPLTLGVEAAAAFWLPLDRALSGELAAVHEHRVGPTRLSFPCWRYQGHTIWGLTYRMLGDLLRVIAE